MKLSFQFISIMLFGLILASCISNGNENIKPVPNTLGDSPLTPFPIDLDASYQYWSGGEFEELTVYSLTQGVSQAAHDAFVVCGLDDKVIETLVNSYLADGSEKQVLMAGDLESEPLWEVVMTVMPLTPDIYLVTCSGERT